MFAENISLCVMIVLFTLIVIIIIMLQSKIEAARRALTPSRAARYLSPAPYSSSQSSSSY